MKFRILRWFGICAYFCSYFLPAVGNPEQHPMRSMPGWACAFFSIWFGIAGIGAHGVTPEGQRFFLSLLPPGLTNPLFIIYLLLILKRKALIARRVLIVLILVFMSTITISLHLIPFVPVAGFYVWLTGLAMTLFPELIQIALELRVRWEKRKGASA